MVRYGSSTGHQDEQILSIDDFLTLYWVPICETRARGNVSATMGMIADSRRSCLQDLVETGQYLHDGQMGRCKNQAISRVSCSSLVHRLSQGCGKISMITYGMAVTKDL